MAITEVVVNYTARNYFNDYDEIRVDRMSNVSEEKIVKAINKMASRFRSHGAKDTMFFHYDDETAYRLCYQTVDMEEYEHPVLGTMFRGGREALMLRHYTYSPTDSWDTEYEVTAAKAKRLILEGEQE